MEKKPTFAELIRRQIHASVNFVIGALLVLGVLLLPENSFGKIIQIVLGFLSIFMLGDKTWKFVKRGFLHFSLEDSYIFLSSIVILTLVVWLPSYIFGLSLKIAFGIAGLVVIILAISDFLRHLNEFRNS